MKLRVATYNIHKGVSSIGTRPRVLGLKDALGTMDADVLFLQEVQGRHDLMAARHAAAWPQQAQHEFLAGDSHHAAYGMNAVYDHGHHGNALLSAFPIASWQNQNVSDHAYESRGILHCVIQAPATEVHCYVIHLGLFAGTVGGLGDALGDARSHRRLADHGVAADRTGDLMARRLFVIGGAIAEPRFELVVGRASQREEDHIPTSPKLTRSRKDKSGHAAPGCGATRESS